MTIMVRMNHEPLEDGETAIENAYAMLRSWTQGLFRFDEHVQNLKYVIAPDGRLIAPVMVAALQTADTALYIPDDESPALQLLLSLEPFEDRGEGGKLADRWRIHHGEEEDINWTTMEIDMVRFSGLVIDGEAIVRTNLFAEVEAPLCRAVNELGNDAMRTICRSKLDVDVEHPLAVAVDPLGIDIRARFDILRLPFGTPIEDPDRVLDVVASWARA
jgi:hypothetical protein